MHPTSRPSWRMARSMDSPSPSSQKRRLFSRSTLGMIGMHDSTSIYASVPPTNHIQPSRRLLFILLITTSEADVAPSDARRSVCLWASGSRAQTSSGRGSQAEETLVTDGSMESSETGPPDRLYLLGTLPRESATSAP